MDTLIEKIIEKYVNKLEKKDIADFSEENGIKLNKNEVDLLYDNIKLYWRELIFKDHKVILEKLNNKIDSTTYKKIEELIILYKDRYKNYL